MGPYKSPAVPIRKTDFSETSQILRLLTREAGKINAIARGSKRKKGPFPGPFDLFIEYEIVWISKGPERLNVLTAATLRADFPVLRTRPLRLYAASYGAELLDELTPEAVPVPSTYELWVGFLRELQQGVGMPLCLFRFEARLLRDRGFFPRLLECGACRRRITRVEAWFSPRDGGAVCDRCPLRDRDAFRVPVRVLYALQNLPGNADLPPGLYREVAPGLRRLLDLHIRHVIDRTLKTHRFALKACFP